MLARLPELTLLIVIGACLALAGPAAACVAFAPASPCSGASARRRPPTRSALRLPPNPYRPDALLLRRTSRPPRAGPSGDDEEEEEDDRGDAKDVAGRSKKQDEPPAPRRQPEPGRPRRLERWAARLGRVAEASRGCVRGLARRLLKSAAGGEKAEQPPAVPSGPRRRKRRQQQQPKTPEEPELHPPRSSTLPPLLEAPSVQASAAGSLLVASVPSPAIPLPLSPPLPYSPLMPLPSPPSSPSPASPSPPPPSPSSSSPLGGVVGIIEQFEALRSSQRLGSQTSQLLSELRNSVAAEGHSHGNSVRVVLDGTQRVRSVEFADEHFLRTSEPYEVSAAVVEAFQNAHAKSVEKMDERLKNFYTKASAHSPIGNLWS